MKLNESYIVRLQELAGIVSEVQTLDRLRVQFVDSGKITPDDFNKIISVSEKKEYVNWLVKKVYDKIIPIEQLDIYKKYIEIFDRRKSDFEKQDIFQYKTSEDVKNFEEESKKLIDIEIKDPSKQKGLTKDDKFANLKIGQVIGFDVYMLPKERKDLYESSVELGTGTGWCTANGKNRASFDSHISSGPLFIFIKPNTDLKYQISVAKGREEFKNNKNINVLESDKFSFYIFLIKKFPEYDLSIIANPFVIYLIKESIKDERIMKYLQNNGHKLQKIFITEETFNIQEFEFFMDKYIEIIKHDLSGKLLKKLPYEFMIDYYRKKFEKRDYNVFNIDFKEVPKNVINFIGEYDFSLILRNFWLSRLNKNFENISHDDYEKLKFYIENSKYKNKLFKTLINNFDGLENDVFIIKLFDKLIDSEMAVYALVESNYDPIIKKTLSDISKEFMFDEKVFEKFDLDRLVEYLTSIDFDSEKINEDGLYLIIKIKLNEISTFSLYDKIEKKYEKENKVIPDSFFDFTIYQQNINLLSNVFYSLYRFKNKKEILQKLINGFIKKFETINYHDLYKILRAFQFIKEITKLDIHKEINLIISKVPSNTIKKTFENYGGHDLHFDLENLINISNKKPD